MNNEYFCPFANASYVAQTAPIIVPIPFNAVQENVKQTIVQVRVIVVSLSRASSVLRSNTLITGAPSIPISTSATVSSALLYSQPFALHWLRIRVNIPVPSKLFVM